MYPASKAVPCCTCRVMVWAPKITLGPHPSAGMESSFDISFPSFSKYSLMWTAFPVGTRPPGAHFSSWVDWSNVNKVSCSKKKKQQ